MVHEHLEPAELQHSPPGLHQRLLPDFPVYAVHDAEKLALAEEDVHVFHAPSIRRPHEARAGGVDLRVLEALHVLDQLAVDGVHDELQHLSLHGPLLLLHEQTLVVDALHPG